MAMEVKIWRWEDAPQHLKNLSTNGGDEDFVVLIPAELVEEFAPEYAAIDTFVPSELNLIAGLHSLQRGIEALGVCGTDYHSLDNGDVVAIAYHA